MSNVDDRKESTEDELFVQKVSSVFDHSVEGLDGEARSRLNRSRQAALAELDSGSTNLGRWTQWAPAAGAAAVAVVAVVMISTSPEVDQVINPDATQMAGDFELLMTEDAFDMLQDLEFYSWVDIDAALESEPGADVG